MIYYFARPSSCSTQFVAFSFYISNWCWYSQNPPIYIQDRWIICLWIHLHRWLGFTGQFRPKKLISDIKAEISTVDEWELPVLKDIGKHFLEKSLYAFGLCSQLSLTPSSSLLLSTEKHGEKKQHRLRAMLFHKARIWILYHLVHCYGNVIFVSLDAFVIIFHFP